MLSLISLIERSVLVQALNRGVEHLLTGTCPLVGERTKVYPGREHPKIAFGVLFTGFFRDDVANGCELVDRGTWCGSKLWH
jgi:hypothetical protein